MQKPNAMAPDRMMRALRITVEPYLLPFDLPSPLLAHATSAPGGAVLQLTIVLRLLHDGMARPTFVLLAVTTEMLAAAFHFTLKLLSSKQTVRACSPMSTAVLVNPTRITCSAWT